MSTLFVTDLDGTLLDAEARLSAESAALLRPLLDEGLLLTVATARTPATVVPLLRPLRLRAPAVLMTGAMLFDPVQNRCLSTTPMDPRAAQEVCDILERTGQEALAYCVRDGRLVVYYKRLSCDFERAFVARRSGSPYKMFVRTASYPEALRAAAPLLFVLALPNADAARDWYSIFHPVSNIYCHYYEEEYGSGGYLLELFPAGCTKASALARVMELTGAARMVSFGDNINDIPMFRMSDHSCAVANAVPEVRAAASCVIGANTADGVARWLAQHGRDWL